MTDFESPWTRLLRGNVVRAGIAHIIVAWLFLQVADVVLPYVGIVDQPVRSALLISVATFPVTLLIAWFADAGRKVAGIFVIVGLTFGCAWWVMNNLPDAVRERTTIVILPLEHSGDMQEASLSRALTEEVGSLLMRSRAIDVIDPESANSAVLQGLGTVAVADRLRVESVLSGSVSASGNSMQIRLRLLNAVGQAIWSGVIEESIANLASVQANIATEIEQRLGVQGEDVVPVSQVAAERCWMPPEADALQKYFTARHYVEMRNSGAVSRGQIAEAVVLYQELLDAYPAFAEARAGLAWAYEYQHTYHPEDEIENFRQEASTLAAEALEDCPTLGEAMHLTANPYDHENRWISEWQQLSAAIDMEPHKSENYQKLSHHYFMTGLWDKALEVAERNYALNPLSVRSISALASVLQYHGDLERAIELSELSIELGSTKPNFAAEQKARRACAKGDLDCFIQSLSGEMAPVYEPFRVIYRSPESDEQAQESLELAYQLLEQAPQLMNWFNGSTCSFEHLTPLFFRTWEFAKGNDLWGRWFYPNAWRDVCTDIQSAPEFVGYVEVSGLPEYWREAGWPDACQPQGEGFACGRNIEAE